MEKSSWRKHPVQGQKPRSALTVEEVGHFTDEFNKKQEYLSLNLDVVTPYEYYRDMFPEGSFENEDASWAKDDERRPNGIVSVLIDPDQPGRKYNRIVFDDLTMIEELSQKVEFMVVPPIGFSGRRRLSKFAYKFYGMCIDLDDVGVKEIRDLLFQMMNQVLPMASYIVNSGTGLHVVYLFETPIPAFPKYYESLGKLKQALSDLVWNHYTSREKNKQFQGIFQGFRAVGSQTKISSECRVTAYKLGAKVSINYLNEYVDEEFKCEFDDLNYTSLEEAKEQWSDWYQRRIVENQPVGHYKLTEKQKIRRKAWYESWKKRIKKGAFEGNRYHCVCVLFNYAMKAEIPIEDVLEDALELIPFFEKMTTSDSNHFTEDDVYCAMKYYSRKFIKMGRNGILKMTKIDIGKTERKGQNQADHLEEARAIRDLRMKRKKKSWRDGNGRPVGSGTAEETVQLWQEKFPNKTKADCSRETGLDPKTVRKWWKTDGKNKKVGRPVGSGTAEQKIKLYKEQHPNSSVSTIAKELGISRPTVYKWTKED